MLSATRKIVHRAQRAIEQVGELGRKQQKQIGSLRQPSTTMMERANQVIRQRRAHLRRRYQYPDKIASVFEPPTEIICKGKASKPAEFAKLVKIQEAQNQIVTGYAVYEERPADSAILVATKRSWMRRGEECLHPESGNT